MNLRTGFFLLLTCLFLPATVSACQSADMSFDTAQGCTTVSGNLRIDNTALTSLSGLESLTSVGGNLEIYGNSALTSLSGLDNLNSVGGYLWIRDNSALTTMSGLDNLNSVGSNLLIIANSALTNMSGLGKLNSVGYLGIENNSALTTMSGLDNLTIVSGYMWIIANNALTTMSGLDNLNSVGSSLEIEYNSALTTMSGLNNLKRVGGNLEIEHNSALTTMSGLDNLTSVRGHLRIVANGALTTMSGLDSLNNVGRDPTASEYWAAGTWIMGHLSISENSALTTMSGLGNLTRVRGDLSIQQNGALNSMSGLDNLISVGGSLWIKENSALTTMSGLDSLISVSGDLNISFNSALTTMSGLGNLNYVSSSLEIYGNSALTTMSGLDSLNRVWDLRIYNNSALTTMSGLDSLNTVEDLRIYNNSALTTMSGLGNLNYVGSSLEIYGNSALTTMSGLDSLNRVDDLRIYNNSALTTMSGLGNITKVRYLMIYGNSALTNMSGLGNLISVGGIFYGSLEIYGNSALTTMSGLESLNYVSHLNIYDNSALTNVSGLDSLNRVDYLMIYGNSALTTMSGLDSLNSVLRLQIYGNSALTNMSGLDNLYGVVSSLEIYGNSALTTMSGLGNLYYVGEDLRIWDNSALTSMSGLNSLKLVDGNLEIEHNSALTTMSGLDNLTSVGGHLRIVANGALTSLRGLENLNYVGGLWIADNSALSSLKAIEGLMAKLPCDANVKVDTKEIPGEAGFEELCLVESAPSIEIPLPVLIVSGVVLLVFLPLFVLVHRKRIPSSRPEQIFFTVLSLYDFSSDALFAAFLHYISDMAAFYASVAFLALSFLINSGTSLFVLRHWMREVPEFAQWRREHGCVTFVVAAVCATSVDNLHLLHCGLFSQKAFLAPLGEEQLQNISGGGLSTLLVEDLPQFAIQLIVLVSQANNMTWERFGVVFPFCITLISMAVGLAKVGSSLIPWHQKRNLPATAVLIPFVAGASLLSFLCSVFWIIFHKIVSSSNELPSYHRGYLIFFCILSVVNSVMTIVVFPRLIPCSWFLRHPLVVAVAFAFGCVNCVSGIKLLRSRVLGLEALPHRSTAGAIATSTGTGNEIAMCASEMAMSFDALLATSVGAFLDLVPLACYTIMITRICAKDIHEVRQGKGAEALFQWVFAIINPLLLIVAVRTYSFFHVKATSHQVPETSMANYREAASDSVSNHSLTQPTKQPTEDGLATTVMEQTNLSHPQPGDTATAELTQISLSDPVNIVEPSSEG
eukprot:g44795.t1